MHINPTLNLKELFVWLDPILYWRLPKRDKRGNEVRSRVLVQELSIGRNLEALKEVAEAVKRGDADIQRLYDWQRLMNAIAAAETIEKYRKSLFDVRQAKWAYLAEVIQTKEKGIVECDSQLRNLQPKLAELAASAGLVLNADAPIALDTLGRWDLELIAAKHNLPAPVETRKEDLAPLTAATSGIAWGLAMGFATGIIEPTTMADNIPATLVCGLGGICIVLGLANVLQKWGRSAGDHAYIDGAEDAAKMRRLRQLHKWGFAVLACLIFGAGFTLESFAFQKAAMEASVGDTVKASGATGRIIAMILTGMTVAYYSTVGWEAGYNRANLRCLKLKQQEASEEFYKSEAFSAMVVPATSINRLLGEKGALQAEVTAMKEQMAAEETEDELRRIHKLEIDAVRYAQAAEPVFIESGGRVKWSFWAWLRSFFGRRKPSYGGISAFSSLCRTDQPIRAEAEVNRA